MRCCCICQKKDDKISGSFFYVPKDEVRRKKWSDITKIKFKKKSCICMEHFLPSDLIKSGGKVLLMPRAVPYIKSVNMSVPVVGIKAGGLPNKGCILGCMFPNCLYIFPSRHYERKRRKIWLDYFDLEDPKIDTIYACDRHFSPSQTFGKGIRLDAIPDVPCSIIMPNAGQYGHLRQMYKKKGQETRSVIKSNYIKQNIAKENISQPLEESLVHDKELPEILEENLYNIKQNLQPLHTKSNSVLEIPILKPISKGISTQTNTRLCGTVQVSEFVDDYRFNCFFCCQTFPLEKWKNFVAHFNEQHYTTEAAFYKPKYVSPDHDYTSISKPFFSSLDTRPLPLETETLVIDTEMFPYLFETQDSRNKQFETIILNPLYHKTDTNNASLDRLKVVITNSIVQSEPTGECFKVKRRKSMLKNRGYIKKSKFKPCQNKTTLSRCLKRTIKEKILSGVGEQLPEPFATDTFQQKTTELTFEYTPKDIINLLLDIMKNYPVLWKFDSEKFNQDYSKAIEDLCKIINEKWALNIDTLKMRRSVNRVLRFYLSVYPLQNIEDTHKFTDYYDKCNEFLPKTIQDIAYARCCYCDITFKCNYDLKNHLLEEQSHMLWPYKCQECKECFRDSDEFEFHKILPHYQEVFHCEKCSKKTFTRRSLYNKHLNEHLIRESSDPAKYKCKQCDKVFKHKSNLNAHMLSHGERKFKCHLCPRAFHQASSLKNHLKIHRNEYNIICEICGKAFLLQSNLNKHMATHTKAKVTCNICNLRLRKSSLNRHLRLVHVAYEGTIETTRRAQHYHYKSLFQGTQRRSPRGPYKRSSTYHCKICDLHFEGFKLLVEHNKTFHADKIKWSCKICSSEYSFKPALRRHYRLKHNLHRYQIHKLVDLKEDLEMVLAIKQEDIDKLAETATYHLNQNNSSPRKKSKVAATTTTTTNAVSTTTNSIIIKSEPLPGEIFTEEERMPADTIQDEIMKAADNIAAQEIKIDNDHYMNDFLTSLLK